MSLEVISCNPAYRLEWYMPKSLCCTTAFQVNRVKSWLTLCLTMCCQHLSMAARCGYCLTFIDVCHPPCHLLYVCYFIWSNLLFSCIWHVSNNDGSNDTELRMTILMTMNVIFYYVWLHLLEKLKCSNFDVNMYWAFDEILCLINWVIVNFFLCDHSINMMCNTRLWAIFLVLVNHTAR